MSTRIPGYERPAVLDSIPARGHVVIEASAGTGKTFTLEHLIVDLLLAGDVTLDRILVVTFTDKATRELRERVRKKLQDVLAKVPEREEAGRRLKDALFSFDNATISTIHGFCQRVLTEQAFAGRRLLEQTQVDGAEAFHRAFRECLRERVADDDEVGETLRRVLSEQSAEDLAAQLRRCHVERGVLTPPWDPEALQRACAGLPAEADLERAVRAGAAALGAGGAHHLVRHAKGLLAVVAEHGHHPFDLDGPFRDWAKGKAKLNGEEGTRLSQLRVLLGAAEDPAATAYLQSLDLIERHVAPPLALLAQRLLPEVSARLEARKRSLGLFDFDDMLTLVREALEGEEGERLVRALRDRFRYALIDEFQDTDEVQWAIFRRLFFESPEHRLFVIGDPKQAIYGFRNADLQTYLGARDEIVAAGNPAVVLQDNYRSTEPLISAVNHVLAQGFFSGDNDYPHPVRCGDPSRALTGPGGEAVAPVCLVHLQDGAGDLRAGQVRAGLAAFMAHEIARLTGPGGPRLFEKDAARPLSHADIHVLTRTGGEGRDIGEVLRRHGIPYAFYRQEGLFQTDEAADVLAVLRALAHPERRSARLAAWLTPFFGVPLGRLAACAALPETDPLVEDLLGWRALAERQHWGRLFRALLDESGLARRLLFAHPGERELTNYQHLFEILLEEVHHAPLGVPELAGRLQAFIEERALPAGRDDADVQRLESERDSVQILTMHKAKGLEAPVVFVAGGFSDSPGGIPNVYHQDGVRHAHVTSCFGRVAEAVARETREENERLVYVAMTRAKGRLYLPFFGPAANGAPFAYKRLGGTYRLLAERLAVLAPVDQPLPRSFERVNAPCSVADADTEGAPQLSAWSPDPAQLAPAPAPVIPFEALRTQRAGVLVTSYSRMKHGHPTARLSDPDEVAALRDDAEGEPLAAPVEGDLPGGKGVGVFLHEALERLDPARVRGVPLQVFREDPEALRLFEKLAAGHGLDAVYLGRAMELVHTALTSPVRAGRLELPLGFASLERSVPELPFLYPIPEDAHPRLGGSALTGKHANAAPHGEHAKPSHAEQATPAHAEHAADGPAFEVGRGFIQGVIDLVFEHQGRYWLLDWKSDRLPRYDVASLDAHVKARYAEQARIYALAVLRVLGLSTAAEIEAGFGGILYCFLRGLDAKNPAAGVWFTEPGLDELAGWERWLLDNDRWGVLP